MSRVPLNTILSGQPHLLTSTAANIHRNKLNPCLSFQLKAVLLNTRLENVAHAEVKFDSDLPEFRTSGGVNAGAAKNE